MSEIPKDIWDKVEPAMKRAEINNTENVAYEFYEVAARLIMAERVRCAQVCREMPTTTGLEQIYANRIEAGWVPATPQGER